MSGMTPSTRRIEDTFLHSVFDPYHWGDNRMHPAAPSVRAVAATACAKQWSRECEAMSRVPTNLGADRINDIHGLSEGERHIRRTAEAKWGKVEAGQNGCSIVYRDINPHNPEMGRYSEPVGDCHTVARVEDPADLESKQMELCLESPYLCPQILESACALQQESPPQNGPVYRRLQGYCQYNFAAPVSRAPQAPAHPVVMSAYRTGPNRFDHIPYGPR